MTQKEIIYNIRNLVSTGRTSSFDKLSDRQLAYIIDYYRAYLIRIDLEKGRSINDAILQKFDIDIKPDECEENFYYEKFPSAIDTHHCDTITYVGYKGKQYTRLGANRVEFESFAKFTSKKPKYWIEGTTLWVKNPVENHNAMVHVRGVFERPIEVVTLLGERDAYDEFNFHYPISNNMINQLYALITSNELKVLLPEVETDGGDA